jgi:hypothetical protein
MEARKNGNGNGRPSSSFSFSGYENIKIDFPSFEFWIDAFNKSMREYLRSTIHAALQLQRYEHARQQYLRNVRRQLLKLLRSRVAQAVIAEISSRRPHLVVVTSYRPPDDDDLNAKAHSVNLQDAVPSGTTVLDSDGDVIIEQHIRLTGTGNGSNSKVNYTAGVSSSDYLGHAPAADEVLLHELIHASRQVSGVSRQRGVNRSYDYEEEFVAIMIDNIYLPEKNKSLLRDTCMTDEIGQHDTFGYSQRFADFR